MSVPSWEETKRGMGRLCLGVYNGGAYVARGITPPFLMAAYNHIPTLERVKEAVGGVGSAAGGAVGAASSAVGGAMGVAGEAVCSIGRGLKSKEGAVVVGGLGVPSITSAIMSGVGFKAGGVALGSWAASSQPACVAAGSLFATLQSVGATGGVAVLGPVGIAGAGLGLGTYYFLSKMWSGGPPVGSDLSPDLEGRIDLTQWVIPCPHHHQDLLTLSRFNLSISSHIPAIFNPPL